MRRQRNDEDGRHTVALVSPKGGTGKSTLAIALAVAAAARCRTLLIDLDPQATAARWHLSCRPPSAPVPPEALSVIRCRPEELAARAAASGARFIVCDTAGGAYRALAAAAAESDLLIAPMQTNLPDLASAPKLAAFIAELPSPPPLAAVLNRVQPAAARRLSYARSVLAASGVLCLETAVTQSVVWPDSYEEGLAPCEIASRPRAARAAAECESLYREVFRLLKDGTAAPIAAALAETRV